MPAPDDELIAALERELLSAVRHSRATTHRLARSVHPNLDPTFYPLVAFLAWRAPVRISDLAEELSLDKSTISRHIDSLTRLGLVTRTSDPQDARARLVSLTETGVDTIRQQQRARRASLHEKLSTWDSTEVEELTRLLRKLSDARSQPPDRGDN